MNEKLFKLAQKLVLSEMRSGRLYLDPEYTYTENVFSHNMRSLLTIDEKLKFKQILQDKFQIMIV